MFQTKVLATALAALVASTHVVEAETREERAQKRAEDQKDSGYKYADCKLEDIPFMQIGTRGVIRLRQTEEGDYEVDNEEEESADDVEDGQFKIKFQGDDDENDSSSSSSSSESICDGVNFRQKYDIFDKTIQLGFGADLPSLVTGKAKSQPFSISHIGDSFVLSDGKMLACCKIVEEKPFKPLKVIESEERLDQQIEFDSDSSDSSCDESDLENMERVDDISDSEDEDFDSESENDESDNQSVNSDEDLDHTQQDSTEKVSNIQEVSVPENEQGVILPQEIRAFMDLLS